MKAAGWSRWLVTFWRSRRWYVRLTRVAVLLLIVPPILYMLGENHLIYHPVKFPEGDWDTSAFRVYGDHFSTVEPVWFEAADGVRLHGWLCRPARRADDGSYERVPTDWAVLHCHGNAGNISGRRPQISLFNQLPAAVFIFDYRGYGRSAGSPDEAGLYADVEGAWEVLRQRGFAADRMIVHGSSLGSGPAAEIAQRKQPAALVLEAAFTSIPDLAADLYPLVPRLLVRTQFDNRRKVAAIACPKLIVHGTDDEVVPVRHARELAAAAAEPVELYLVEGAPHNAPWAETEAYLEHLRALMRRAEASADARH